VLELRLKSRSQGGKVFMPCFKKSEGMDRRLSRIGRNLIKLLERSREVLILAALKHRIKKRSFLGSGRQIERILNKRKRNSAGPRWLSIW